MAEKIKYADEALYHYASKCDELSHSLMDISSSFSKFANQLQSDLWQGKAGDVVTDAIGSVLCASLHDLSEYTKGLGNRVKQATDAMKSADHR
jgi:uncharacterized protein YukE